VVFAHAQPVAVPSLYPGSLVGRHFQGDKVPLVHALLTRGGGQRVVNGALVRGAPTMQELYPIKRPSGETIAVLQGDMALLEHERQRKRAAVLRRAIAQLRDQVLRGRLEGAERISRLNVHDGIMVIDERGRIAYVSQVAEHLYFRLGYTETLVNTALSELDTNEYICFRAMELGECLEQRLQEQDV